TQELKAIHRISGVSRTLAESPATFVANGIDHRQADRFFEAFQLAQDDGAMRPRTGERDVKMVAVTLRRVRGRAVAFHPIAKRVFLPFEFAGLGLFLWKLRHQSDRGAF